MTDCKRVSKSVTNEEEVVKDEKAREKLIGKFEKEKQNCLLKVNLSQPKSKSEIYDSECAWICSLQLLFQASLL